MIFLLRYTFLVRLCTRYCGDLLALILANLILKSGTSRRSL